jgi:hypothetical protein
LFFVEPQIFDETQIDRTELRPKLSASVSICENLWLNEMDLKPHIEKFRKRFAEVESLLSDCQGF